MNQAENKKILLKVEGIYKKFCKKLSHNMIYGMIDLSKAFFGLKINRSILRKHEFWAINNINIEFYEKEITALLGVNGSGKTSLIRMLAGIYNSDKGNITYSDSIKSVVSIFAIKSGLHPTLSGKENIYLKSAYYGVNKKEVDEKLDFIIEFAGIKDYINAPLGNYSSGMKTRLAMSIALSIDADILFVDEGFSFSDPGFKMKCFDFLKNKYQSKNKSMIFATHQLGKISQLADRVILLDSGKIILNTKDVEFGVQEYLKYCN